MTNSSKAAAWVQRILALLGAVAIGIWAWAELRTTIYQQAEDKALEREIEQKPSALPRPQSHFMPRVGDMVGRLEIPRLHMQAIVAEGVDSDTLGRALGHVPGTALPGQDGNIAVAGHRDTLFRGLRAIARGDLILFRTAKGTYQYRVEGTRIVQPGEVSVLAPSEDSELTLITCYPFYYVGSAPQRFIVKAYGVTQASTSGAWVSPRTHPG